MPPRAQRWIAADDCMCVYSFGPRGFEPGPEGQEYLEVQDYPSGHPFPRVATNKAFQVRFWVPEGSLIGRGYYDHALYDPIRGATPPAGPSRIRGYIDHILEDRSLLTPPSVTPPPLILPLRPKPRGLPLWQRVLLSKKKKRAELSRLTRADDSDYSGMVADAKRFHALDVKRIQTTSMNEWLARVRSQDFDSCRLLYPPPKTETGIDTPLPLKVVLPYAQLLEHACVKWPSSFSRLKLPKARIEAYVFRGFVYMIEATPLPRADVELLVRDAYERESKGIMRLRTKYDCLENGRSREPIPEEVRFQVWRRDQGKCCKCGSRENLEFDHIIPHSLGGSDTARNLQILCGPCNREKRDNLA